MAPKPVMLIVSVAQICFWTVWRADSPKQSALLH